MNLIDKAVMIALKVHGGKLDKAGVAYIMHPAAVAAKGRNDAERILGWLHDVIEDSPEEVKAMVMAEIFDEFGEEIGNALDAISRRVGPLRELYLAEYIVRVDKNPLARAVKIHDLLHNSDLSRIANPSHEDLSRVHRYRRALDYFGIPF
jgi:(p)ppGpp synthase/HD superfamily hydrolase